MALSPKKHLRRSEDRSLLSHRFETIGSRLTLQLELISASRNQIAVSEPNAERSILRRRYSQQQHLIIDWKRRGVALDTV
ncbi:hypothetical protein L596_011049 [Steinernema carpocapsae]|uniref:Uncharacterized protein n=1 Tax=Steinernema carpocapsae TaxID=34508 RepID=A0A4U5NS88_STECR|nr:hypothetical protein L596_011049 [Steinernema carpocapsae]